MQKVQALVAAQTVVLGILVLLWWQREDTAPPAAPYVHRDASAEGAASPASSRVAPFPTTHERPAERTAAPTTASSGARTVVLHGRLLGIEPPPNDTTARVAGRSDTGWCEATIGADGQYAIAGLQPGIWHLSCDTHGCRKIELDHTLTDAPIQRLDLRLERATVLPIHVRTSSGARLATELTKADVWLRLQVVATPEPLAGDFAPSEFSGVGDIGVGRHRRSWDMNQLAEADGDEGTLELDRPPPVHAALLLRHLLLAQQRIEPGQRELHFTVDVETVLAKYATVRLRVVDPNGQPLSGAMVMLDLSRRQMASTTENGTVLVKDVLPGLAHFSIRAPNREAFVTNLWIGPGANLDLGDVVLHPAVKIQGHVVDADGKPSAAAITWTNLDRWQAPLPLNERSTVPADGDGNYQLQVGPHRYLVQARTDDGRIGHGVLDGRTAAASGPITVRTGTAVQFVASGPMTATCRVVVKNRDGHPIDVRALEPRLREQTVTLLPGDYTLELYEGERTLLRRQALTVGTTKLRVVVP